MNILYIWDADYPWDIRVEKICNSLSSNGHNVHIASRNLKKKPVYEAIDDLHIHRLSPWKNSNLNYVMTFPAFFNPVWLRFINKIIQNDNIDLIMVRDLPMSISGIWLGKHNNIPVIFDMAENYVELVRDIWKKRKYKGLNLIVRNPYLAKLVERYTLKRIDKILVVTEEAKNVVIQGGGNAGNVTIVSNTPIITTRNRLTSSASDMLEMTRKRYSVIYTGGLQLGRGIQVVIKALPEIIKIIPDFLFVVIGDGYAAEQLKKMAIDEKVDKYIIWVGWVDQADMFEYLKVSNIGIIPHYVSEHVNTTIPNKIFDYMSCGLPIIASNSPPLKRIVDTEQCGTTFTSGDSISLVKAVKEIYQSDTDYHGNGMDAVAREYNWSVDEKRLLTVIDSMY